MEMLLLMSLLLGFFFTLFFTPIWISRAKKAGLTGKDINKVVKCELAEGGGISVLIGFLLGTLSYVAIRTFYFKDAANLVEIFALLSVILIAALVGLIDDVLGWKIGLNKKSRLFLIVFASIPLVVINAGESTMMNINFGLFYPLFFIPLGIVGATTTYNFLAGYNGLETSQGAIILSALALVTFLTGNSWLSLISLIMVVCLIAFYIYNKYPACIFPGDTLTYPVGALIAIIAILGNIEKIAIFFFIPYILETILKLRGKLKKESFAKVNEQGNLEIPYQKFYGVEHIAIHLLKKIKKQEGVKERDVVYLINFFQIIIIALGLLLFKGGIF